LLVCTMNPVLTDDPQYGALIPTLGASVLSLLGCAYLLLRLHALPAHTRRRLFPRQLWHLALADAILAVGSGLTDITLFWLKTDNQDISWAMCNASLRLGHFGRLASVLVEVEISVGFALTFMRRTRGLSLLKTSLPFIWPIGLLLTAVSVLQHPDAYGRHRHECRVWAPWGSIGSVIVSTALAVGVACYASAACSAITSPLSVQAAVWRRASIYPMNFFVTTCPALACGLGPGVGANLGLLVIALTMMHLNGFLNMLTYAWQSRYAQILVVGGAVEAKDSSICSFHVAVEEPVEVVAVDAIAWEARQQADADTSQLAAESARVHRRAQDALQLATPPHSASSPEPTETQRRCEDVGLLALSWLDLRYQVAQKESGSERPPRMRPTGPRGSHALRPLVFEELGGVVIAVVRSGTEQGRRLLANELDV